MGRHGSPQQVLGSFGPQAKAMYHPITVKIQIGYVSLRTILLPPSRPVVATAAALVTSALAKRILHRCA